MSAVEPAGTFPTIDTRIKRAGRRRMASVELGHEGDILQRAGSDQGRVSRISVGDQDDLALYAAVSRPLMRARGVRQPKATIDYRSNCSVREQRCRSSQLCTVGTNLRRRYFDAQRVCLFLAGEAQRVDQEKGTTGLQRAEKPFHMLAAHRIENKVRVANSLIGGNFGVVNELIYTEIAHQRLILAGRNSNNPCPLPFCELHGQVPNTATGTVDEHRLTLKGDRLMGE